MAAPAVHSMPSRGQRSAPTFNPAQPRELERYFTDLETQFNQSNITTDADKKKWAIQYTDIDTSDMWKSLPQYGVNQVTNQQYTYDEFKAAVVALYPGANEDRKYAMPDLDILVGQTARNGIHSLNDLAQYYQRYFTISIFLVNKGHCSTIEQGRMYLHGFQPLLKNQILQRLQLKLPDHHPSDPYTLNQIQEAASFILSGTYDAPVTASGLPTPPVPLSYAPAHAYNPYTAVTTPPLPVKNEEFTSFIELLKSNLQEMKALSKTVADLVMQQGKGRSNQQRSESSS